jgi:hypothetical protein
LGQDSPAVTLSRTRRGSTDGPAGRTEAILTTFIAALGGLEFLYTLEGREWACEARDRRFVSPWMTHLNSRSRSSGRERRANSAATTAPLRAIQLVTVMLSTDMALLLLRKRMSKALSSASIGRINHIPVRKKAVTANEGAWPQLARNAGGTE